VLCCFDSYFVHRRGVTDVSDARIELHRPEKRYVSERLGPAEDVPRRRLTLALCDHPVLHPDAASCPCIMPARDVARGVDAGIRRAEVLIDENPVVDGQAGTFGKPCVRLYAHTHDHEISRELLAVIQHHGRGIDARDRAAETEADAARGMQVSQEGTQSRTQRALDGYPVRSDHGDIQTALPQRGGDFHPDEARSGDDHGPTLLHTRDDRATVG